MENKSLDTKPEAESVTAGSAGAASVAVGEAKAVIGADTSTEISAGDNSQIDARKITNEQINVSGGNVTVKTAAAVAAEHEERRKDFEYVKSEVKSAFKNTSVGKIVYAGEDFSNGVKETVNNIKSGASRFAEVLSQPIGGDKSNSSEFEKY